VQVQYIILLRIKLDVTAHVDRERNAKREKCVIGDTVEPLRLIISAAIQFCNWLARVECCCTSPCVFQRVKNSSSSFPLLRPLRSKTDFTPSCRRSCPKKINNVSLRCEFFDPLMSVSQHVIHGLTFQWQFAVVRSVSNVCQHCLRAVSFRDPMMPHSAGCTNVGSSSRQTWCRGHDP